MLKNIAKISLPFALSLAIFSCGNIITAKSGSDVTSIASTSSLVYENGQAVISVGKEKGATLDFSLNLNNTKSFGVKLAPTPAPTAPINTNGVAPKTSTLVKSYKVWLIKNPSVNYPPSGDPMAVANIVAGPFELDATLTNGVSFTNVGDSMGNYYSMAVRAYDGVLVAGHVSGNELIKQNNGNQQIGWTGSSAFPNNKIAVSNSMKVDSQNKVSTTTALQVIVNLEDGYGARVNSEFKLSPNIGASSATKCGGITGSSYIDTFAYGSAPISYTFTNPNSIKIDNTNGDVYVMEQLSSIKKISKAGVVTQVAGAPSSGAYFQLALDGFGSLYYSDGGKIMKRDSLGTTTTYAGATSLVPSDTPAQKATLATVFGIAVDAIGNLYLASDASVVTPSILNGVSYTTPIIAKIDTVGNISLFSSQNELGGNISRPAQIAFNSTGQLYLADNTAGKVYKYLASGGTPSLVASGIVAPTGLAVDTSDNVYVSSQIANLIVKVDTLGAQTVVAGAGTVPVGVMNYIPASTALITTPEGLDIDAAGNLYISEKNGASGLVKVIYNNCQATVTNAPA